MNVDKINYIYEECLLDKEKGNNPLENRLLQYCNMDEYDAIVDMLYPGSINLNQE